MKSVQILSVVSCQSLASGILVARRNAYLQLTTDD